MIAALVASSAADSTGTGIPVTVAETEFAMIVVLWLREVEGEASNVASPVNPVIATKEASYPSHGQQAAFSEPPRSLVRRLARVASDCWSV
jgi:hypothetical protein